ncbi:MAG: InlB B-repeat-containing protein [Lachnospiraceae bacterium]|nr:InlB B-repeat-containing protein [Candidatus Colinaster scatohippi]
MFKKRVALLLSLVLAFTSVMPAMATELPAGETPSVVLEETTESGEVGEEWTSTEESVTSEEAVTKAESEDTSADETSEEVTSEEETAISLEAKEDYEDFEFRFVHGSRELPKEPKLGIVDYTGDTELSLQEVEELPSRWDSREMGWIPNLRNQGSRGTCWAHVAVATAEVSQVRKGFASRDSIDYSEAQLAYFEYNYPADPLGGTIGDIASYDIADSLNNSLSLYDMGGNVYINSCLMANWIGIADESKFPYENAEEDKVPSVELARDDVVHMTEARLLSNKDIRAMKQCILDYGAIQMSYNADWNDYYGVREVYDESGKYIYTTYYVPEEARTNHAITVVGYDDSIPKEHFKTDINGHGPETDGAWLVRNSWTTDNEEGKNYNSYNGYFWLSYCDKSINAVAAFDYEQVSDSCDNLYTYDGGSDYDFCITTSDMIKGANIFTAHSSDIEGNEGVKGELLRKVMYLTGAEDYDYKIDIYINPEDDNPESGIHVVEATTEGHQDYAGYHTVALNNPVWLKEGDKYSVVVSLYSNGTDDSLGIAAECNGEYWYVSKTSIEPGQSFLSTGDEWTDVFELSSRFNWGNLRIKAFTDNDETGAVSHIVTFDPNGGIILDGDETISVREYDRYGVLPIANKEGNDFLGWYTEKDNGDPVTSDNVFTYENDITLYAHWSPDNSHKVTLDATGGMFADGNTIISAYITVGSTYGELQVPQRDGMVFAGWYTKEEGGDRVESTSVFDEVTDITLYAHWTEEEVGFIAQVSKPYATVSELDYYKKRTVFPGTALKLSTQTRGARIYYTTDGSDPVVADATNPEAATKLYTEELDDVFDGSRRNVIIKALAVKAGYKDSSVMTERYVVVDDDSYWGEVLTVDRKAKGYNTPADIPEGVWVAGIYDKDYTGYNITMDTLNIYDHKTLLSEGKDYTVNYTKNKNAGQAKVVIKLKGNYSGTITEYFNIAPLSLGDGTIEGNIADPLDICVEAKRTPTYGTTTVYYDDRILKKGTDYTFDYPDKSEGAYKECDGDYLVNVVGKGNYTGTAVFKETIVSKITKMASLSVGKIPNQILKEYDEDDIADMLVIIDKSDKQNPYTLEYEKDYSIVSIKNPGKPGTVTVVIMGLISDEHKYSGTRNITFNLVAPKPVPITGKKIKFTGLEGDSQYSGYRNDRIDFDLWDYSEDANNPYKLVKGVDYRFGYSNNIDAGKATITIRGIGKYSGTLKKNFTIKPRVITAEDVSLGYDNYPYTKGGVKPGVYVSYGSTYLVEGVDYTVRYTNNTAVNDGSNARKLPTVTVTCKGNYINEKPASGSGAILKFFTISPSTLNYTSLIAKDVIASPVAGKYKTTYTVYDYSGGKLTAGTDYDTSKDKVVYTYACDVNVTQKATGETPIARKCGDIIDPLDIIPEGTELCVTVFGKKNYDPESSVSGLFKVVRGDISKATVAKIADRPYTGRQVRLKNSDFKITLSGKPITADDFEIVEYYNNINKGTAKVTIRGKGLFTGTKTVTFKIVPKSY